MQYWVVRDGVYRDDWDTHVRWIATSAMTVGSGMHGQLIRLVDNEGELEVVSRKELPTLWRELLCVFGKAFHLRCAVFRVADADVPYEVVDLRSWQPRRRKARTMLEWMRSLIDVVPFLREWVLYEQDGMRYDMTMRCNDGTEH